MTRNPWAGDRAHVAFPTCANTASDALKATCEDCKHDAVVNVDNLPDGLYVPDAALKLRCSACGSKKITTRPEWTHHCGS